MPVRVRAGGAGVPAPGLVVDDDDMADGDTIEMINLHAPKQECVLKILLVGGKQVGKTSFIRRFADKPFPRQYVPTIGFDLIVIPVFYAGRKVFLHFWDVSHEEVRSSAGHHALLCHNVAGVFYVLDVSSKDSLSAVDEWHRLLARYIPSRRVPRLLLAHKADLPRSSYVVSDRALDSFVRDAGLTDWCYTVGHEEFGDYVAHRGYESKSVSDAVHMLVDHIFKNQSHAAGRRMAAHPEPLPPMGEAMEEEEELEGDDPRGGPRGSLQPPQGWLPSVDIGELCSRSKRLLRSPSCERLSPQAGSNRARRRIADTAGRPARHNATPPPLLPSSPSARSPSPLLEGSWEAQDSGWRHYAGWIDRDQAMRLLEEEPVGAFLLRRKNESSLVLTYKTQHSIEHAPILFDGRQWGPDISVRPSQPGGSISGTGGAGSTASPLPPTYPSSSSAASSSTPSPVPSVQLKFDTLAGLLRYFSKKASVPSLVFQRRPGTCDYEAIKPQQQHTAQQPAAPAVRGPAPPEASDDESGGRAGMLERFVEELEAVMQAVSTLRHQQDQEAGGEEGAAGQGARLDGRAKSLALVELSRKTRELLLKGAGKGSSRQAAPPAKRPECLDLAVAIRRVEQQVDGLLMLWDHDGRDVEEEQEQRCLLMSWRPVLRVLRLRVE